jgi:hypothetical protein
MLEPSGFDTIIEMWLPLAWALNMVNRSMGRDDLAAGVSVLRGVMLAYGGAMGEMCWEVSLQPDVRRIWMENPVRRDRRAAARRAHGQEGDRGGPVSAQEQEPTPTHG